MTPRKRNMLEAFQSGRDADAARQDPAPARSSRTPPARLEPAGGPLAESAPRAQGAPPTGARGDGLPRWVPIGLGVLLVGFWLGRLSSGWWGAPAAAAGRSDLALETRLSEDSAPPARAPEGRNEAVESAPAAGGYTADDLAFLDRQNKVTLRAIVFDTSPSGQAKALESYRHLRQQSIPAVAPFVAGDLVLICVGAAPSVQDPELARLRELLHTLAGPPPRSEPSPYASAFLVNIDDVVLRD